MINRKTMREKLVLLMKKIFDLMGFRIHRNAHDRELNQLIEFLQPKKTDLALIRIGGIGDGAYLVPDDLRGISLCLSPGSNKQWNFENDLLRNFGIKSAIMDRLENKPTNLSREIRFKDSWLGILDDTSFTTMESWLNELGTDADSDLLLQMDIEGAEYDILFTLPERILQRFRIMIIEFHYSNRFVNSELFLHFHKKIFETIERNFEVVHFHGNNCCGKWKMRDLSLPVVFEVTFLRRDRISRVLGGSDVPHELDSDCVSEMPTLDFNFSPKLN